MARNVSGGACCVTIFEPIKPVLQRNTKSPGSRIDVVNGLVKMDLRGILSGLLLGNVKREHQAGSAVNLLTFDASHCFPGDNWQKLNTAEQLILFICQMGLSLDVLLHSICYYIRHDLSRRRRKKFGQCRWLCGLSV